MRYDEVICWDPILSDKLVEMKKKTEQAKKYCPEDDTTAFNIINKIMEERLSMGVYCSPVTIMTRIRDLEGRLKMLADKHGLVIESEYTDTDGIARITVSKYEKEESIHKRYTVYREDFSNYVHFEQMSAKLLDKIKEDFDLKDERTLIKHGCALAKIKISQEVNKWGIHVDVVYDEHSEMAFVRVFTPQKVSWSYARFRQFAITKRTLLDDCALVKTCNDIVEKTKKYYCLVYNKEETEMPIKYSQIDINKLFVAPITDVIANTINAKKVIFNGPATIVMWKDGSKTVVKAQYGETVDYEKGLAMAIVKYVMGNKGNYYTKFSKLLNNAEVVS